MIPPEGRDVQCSSCGHTWFQNPETAEATLADELGVTEADTSFDIEPAANDPAPAPVGEPGEPVHSATTQDEAPRPRPMDDRAREILREEARREAAVRRRESAGGLESQPELGLDDTRSEAQARAAAVRARLARLRETPDAPETAPDNAPGPEPDPTDAAVAATVAASSRRGLLPDIEEINSTLTATSDRQAEAGSAPSEVMEEDRRGFRRGFILVLGLLAILAALYQLAPTIAARVPATAPALSAYLDWVNGSLDAIRAGLDGALEWLNSLLGGNSQ